MAPTATPLSLYAARNCGGQRKNRKESLVGVVIQRALVASRLCPKSELDFPCALIESNRVRAEDLEATVTLPRSYQLARERTRAPAPPSKIVLEELVGKLEVCLSAVHPVPHC